MKKEAKRPKIVTIGGGTGSFTVLSGLRKHPLDLTAVVAMADSGGSTGVLRSELGVLPPGDLRQCLVALSNSPEHMLKLMNYRFENGGLGGHNFGNILISTFEKVSGDLDRALETIHDIFSVQGRVVPATLDNVHLSVRVGKKWIKGEHIIRENDLSGLQEVRLEPEARANPRALQAILEADMVVVGPGGFYTSILPNFLVNGVQEALRETEARKVLVTNLMNKHGHTEKHTVKLFAEEMEERSGVDFDIVLYNTELPSRSLVRKYATHTGQQVLPIDKPLPRRFMGAKLLSHTLPIHLPRKEVDPIGRTLIRHDSKKLARALMRAMEREL